MTSCERYIDVVRTTQAGFAKMAASWRSTMLKHIIPPARTCKLALDYVCGTAGVRGNATLCHECLTTPYHVKQFKAANCTAQEEGAICANTTVYK